MKPSFYDEYGSAIDKPINAIAYELTSGGDKIRNKPELWSQLAFDVVTEMNKYREFNSLTVQQITGALKQWIDVNEKKEA